MDNEYLQNILGSPYINEGAFDRLKAKGAQTMGGMGAMAGYQIKNPTETRLQSLWDGFIASLERITKDWTSQVSPMLGPDVKLDLTSRQIRKNLDALAKILTPYDVGAYTSSVKSNPSALKTLTKEGIWDATKRNIGLNKALFSNNPSVITNSYKNYVLSLFQNFMRDAIKSTGLMAQQVYNMMAKMQPTQNGWKSAGNMQRVVKQLQKLQGVQKPIVGVPTAIQPSPSVPPIKSSSSLPPPLPPQQSASPSPTPAPTPTASAPQPTPPPLAPQQPQPSSGNQSAANPPSGPATSNPTEDEFEIPTEDMPYVILKTLNMIVDAARSDKDHALGLFGYDPHTKSNIPIPKLSTKWGSGASVTSSLQEDNEGPEYVGYTDPDALAKKAENDAWIHKEYPGEFLYNFQSSYDKFPAHPFSIQVNGSTISPEIKDASGKPIASIEVWWQNISSLNKIYAVEIKNNKTSIPTLILRFYDHYVMPKSGVATPGNQNFFDIYKVMQKSNPRADLTSAPTQIRAEIDNLKDNLLRALLATTHRKTMEFVSKGWIEKKAKDNEAKKASEEMPTSSIDPDGTLHYIDSTSKKMVSVTKDQLKRLLKGPVTPAKAWRDRLMSVNYFDKFPDMPSAVDTTPIWKQAHQLMMAKGYTSIKADKHMGNGWLHIKSVSPNASVWPEDATLTADDLVSAALKQSPQPSKTETPETIISKVPAALDAAKALMTLGHKKDAAFDIVSQAMKILGNGKTTEEYISTALSQPTTIGNPPPEPTKSASLSQQSIPKFKVGDTIETGGAKFKIKYISQNNVVVTDVQDTDKEFVTPKSQWEDWENSGGIKASTTNGVSTPTGNSLPPSNIINPVTNPVSSPVSNTGNAGVVQPQQPEDAGKLSIENGKLVWTVGQNVQKFDAAQVNKMGKKSKFKAAIKANPDVYQQFKNMVNKGGKKKTQESIEYVNPFIWDNFI